MLDDYQRNKKYFVKMVIEVGSVGKGEVAG
jgi:hypothetical protein